LSAVNVAETLLVFVGAPLAIVLVLAALVFLPGGRGRPRYKSGQPWEHEPVWYEPHPENGGGGHGAVAGTPGDRHGETQAIGSSLYGELHGGDGHGSDSHGGSTVPHPPVQAGPLGGARGTW
jgi:hypothetical protein